MTEDQCLVEETEPTPEAPAPKMALQELPPEPPPPAPKPAPKVEVVAPKVQGTFKRISPVALYQPFLAKCELLVAACEKRGARYYATSGLRSWDEQAALYAQGRTKPGKVVTNAKPGQSFHNFAVAIDFCRDADMTRDGLQPEWSLESYRILAEEAKKLGLEAAFFWKTFKEGPHVQLPLERHGITKERLAALYMSGGMKAVFALLDKYNW